MAMQALGQGYAASPGGSAINSAAQSMMEIGRRKNSFQRELAARAMDHELSSIRERDSRDWQSSEAIKNREAERENVRFSAGAKLLEGRDRIKHEGTQASLSRIHDTLARREGFDHEASRADQDSRNRMAEASHHAGIVTSLSNAPRTAGTYSSTASGVSMSSDTEHRTTTEIGEEARAPKKKPGTPMATPAESQAAPSTPVTGPAPSAPLAPPTKKTFRVGPKPPAPGNGPRRAAPKEDRSGGITGTKL